eukprot:761711-Amphidinium_carterae.1
MLSMCRSRSHPMTRHFDKFCLAPGVSNAQLLGCKVEWEPTTRVRIAMGWNPKREFQDTQTKSYFGTRGRSTFEIGCIP